MVLSPMMQIISKLAQQFGPDLVVRGSDLLSSSSSKHSPSTSSTHFRCPKCNSVGNFGDVSGYTHLICSCDYKFPCQSGGTRCACGVLLFPATQTQEIVRCDACFKSWKTKSNQREFGKCRCQKVFEVKPEEKHHVTECCDTPLGQLANIPYKAQEPRVPSEAERNR